MRVYAEFHEKLTIRNEKGQANGVVAKLLDYLKQLNLHHGLLEINIDQMILCVDGIAFKPNKSGVPESDEAELWGNDVAFAKAIESIPQAKEILFEMVWNAEKSSLCRYGIEFFSEYFETISNKDNLAEFVTYRSLENWDSEDKLHAYLFGRTEAGVYEGLVLPDNDCFITKISENAWHLATGKMKITADDLIAGEEELDEFREKADEFAEEFKGVLELEEDEEDFLGFGLCSDSFEPEEIGEMKNKLQYFYDFANEHSAHFELELYFENDTMHDFQYLCLLAEHGKVASRCVKY